MDISSLLPSSDNLYKFLFMGGVFMVVFAFLYPIDKKQKIQLEIVNLNSDIKLESYKIEKIRLSLDSIKKEVNPILEKLTWAKSQKDIKLIKEIQRNFNSSLDIITAKKNEVELKQLEIISEKNKIVLLEKHIKEFESFQFILLIIGPIFIFYGIIKWRKSILVTELIQDIQLRKLARENNMTIPSPSFWERFLQLFRP